MSVKCNESAFYVKYELVVVVVVGGLYKQQGFGADHEPCQGLVEVDYRAWYPSVLNKRMSSIKRLCSPVCCHLTPHFRDEQEAQEPQT